MSLLPTHLRWMFLSALSAKTIRGTEQPKNTAETATTASRKTMSAMVASLLSSRTLLSSLVTKNLEETDHSATE